MLNARRIGEMLAAALEIALVRGDGISDGQGLAAGGVRLATCQRLAGFAGLMERQDVRAIGILKVIGDRKSLGPGCSVTIRGLDHPGAVGPPPPSLLWKLLELDVSDVIGVQYRWLDYLVT